MLRALIRIEIRRTIASWSNSTFKSAKIWPLKAWTACRPSRSVPPSLKQYLVDYSVPAHQLVPSAFAGVSFLVAHGFGASFVPPVRSDSHVLDARNSNSDNIVYWQSDFDLMIDLDLDVVVSFDLALTLDPEPVVQPVFCLALVHLFSAPLKLPDN